MIQIYKGISSAHPFEWTYNLSPPPASFCRLQDVVRFLLFAILLFLKQFLHQGVQLLFRGEYRAKTRPSSQQTFFLSRPRKRCVSAAGFASWRRRRPVLPPLPEELDTPDSWLVSECKCGRRLGILWLWWFGLSTRCVRVLCLRLSFQKCSDPFGSGLPTCDRGRSRR